MEEAAEPSFSPPEVTWLGLLQRHPAGSWCSQSEKVIYFLL